MVVFEMYTLSQAFFGFGALYLVYCIYWELTIGKARRTLIKEKGCLPPKMLPSWDPILGVDTLYKNIQNVRNRVFLQAAKKRFDDMGLNTFGINSLGRTVWVTIEPENLKTIQSLDFKKWSLGSLRKEAMVPLLGHGIFTTDDQQWAHSREMLRPNFVRSQVGDLATFEVHVNHLIQNIPRDGSTVDLQDLFFRLTLDSATEFLFGESTLSLAPGTSSAEALAFGIAFNRSQEHIGNKARFGRWASVQINTQDAVDRKTCHGFVDSFVSKALALRKSTDTEKTGEESGRYIFLNELVKQTSDPIQIRSELLNILLAGRDTTASLLSNVWFELSKRPEVWAKLRSEVDALGGEQPTFQQIKDMKYLRAILNESLRLYPVVPGNSREAVVDTVLPLGGGPDGKSPLFCEKGRVVAWNVYTMHRRKDYYGEDAEEFRPERWLDGEDGKKGLRPGWEYLPFNGGPRICLGQQFALTEASYATVRLVQEFGKIESRDPEPWREWLTLTCTGFGGCKVALTPAN